MRTLSTAQAIAALIATSLLVGSVGVASADQPGAQPATTGSPPAKPETPMDAAVRRGAAPPLIAARAAERVQCREQAAKRKLFGLGRHKFLQRCRRARRKAAPVPPPPAPQR